MVKHAALFLLLLCAFAINVNAMTEYDVPKTRPVVKKVIIEKNGAWSDNVSSDEPPEFCAEFLLKESDVLLFFKIARKASQVEYTHTLDMSRCYVGGRAVLQDGREVTWEIDKARRGIIWLSADNPVFFYCKKCRSKMYWESCDIDCINGN